MSNACRILGEGVLETYILSPLRTIEANDHAVDKIDAASVEESSN